MALRPTKRKDERVNSIMFGGVDDTAINPDEVIIDPNDVIVDEVEINPDDVVVDDVVPDLEGINREVPASVRFELSGLESPQDKLTALRKHYPDAQAVGENFLMTDPETGHQMVLNIEGWMPSWGDLTEFAPEALGIAGGMGGAAIAGAAGTALSPIGAFAAGSAGGGVGYAAGKNTAQSFINDWYGNTDTRSIADQALGVAGDVAIGAAGEGAGRLVAAGARAVGKPIIDKASNALFGLKARTLGGTADDTAAAAQRLAVFDDVGVSPTPGMIARGDTGLRELAASRTPGYTQDGVRSVEDQLTSQWDNALGGQTGANAPSRGETGQVIKDSVEQFGKDAYAQTNRMYDEVGELAGNTPVNGAAVKEHLAKISTRFDKAGTSEKLNLGKTYEGVLGQARAIVDDINKGASFTTVKEARTSINALARDAGTPAEKRMYEELSTALTRDMEDAAIRSGDDVLAKWKAADARYQRVMSDDDVISRRAMGEILNKESTESIYNLVQSSTKNSTAKITRILEQVKAGGGEAAAQEVFRGVFGRLGMNNKGVFSASTLVRDWNKMAPEARDAFMNVAGGSQLKNQMNRLAKAFAEFDAYQTQRGSFTQGLARTVGANVERSVGKLGTVGAVAHTAATGNPVGLATLGIYKFANLALGKSKESMFHNRQFVEWLAGLPRATNPQREISKLRKIADTVAGQTVRAEIRDYLSQLENEFQK
ncbi:hypothetical protein FY134_03155 [Agrobacterium fabrum]|uniref:hypothetical protein n=1 Tax=Agrobacterium fabrum TaxID=1176649 RepID=UPI0021CFE490|nr:hypothetical protein [Agrobacterium fabrum]UXT56697.1 hypothetical protein FY134_03155 [Agrobacterium fabrum]